MNPKLVRIRQESRNVMRVRVCSQTRSASGFQVTVNGFVVHQAPTKEECLSALLAKLQCVQIQSWRLDAAPKI